MKNHGIPSAILGVAAAGLMVTGCHSAAAGKDLAAPKPSISTVYETAPPVTVTVSPPPPPGPAQHFGDDGAAGVWVVGTDIAAGTYHTAGLAQDNTDCYYALLRSTNTEDIIDNNNVSGPATITVGSGVKAVETSGCATWTRQ